MNGEMSKKLTIPSRFTSHSTTGSGSGSDSGTITTSNDSRRTLVLVNSPSTAIVISVPAAIVNPARSPRSSIVASSPVVSNTGTPSTNISKLSPANTDSSSKVVNCTSWSKVNVTLSPGLRSLPSLPFSLLTASNPALPIVRLLIPRAS